MSAPRVLSMIMAGGRGRRLSPLTQERSKPSVPFGGKYRLIDFVLSNCINSGMHANYLLVQYKSQSLIEHMRVGWRHQGISDAQFITVVPPQMRWQEGVWYRGTADAVFQNLGLIHDFQPDIVAVFGADHIYRMDIRQMVHAHLEQRADVTVASRSVPVAYFKGLGLMEADGSDRITAFHEKPAQPVPMLSYPDKVLSSMGNYLFNTEVLVDLLNEDAKKETDHDFGKTILPAIVQSHRVMSYDLMGNRIPGIQPHEEQGYWRDVGTLDTFWQTNMDLLGEHPRFDLSNPHWPIHAAGYDGPPTKIISGDVTNSVVGEGCVIHGATIKNSILGRGVRVLPGCVIEESILMDHTVLQANVRMTRTIVDRFNRIPAGVVLGGAQHDGSMGVQQDSGLVVVPRGPRRGQIPGFRRL